MQIWYKKIDGKTTKKSGLKKYRHYHKDGFTDGNYSPIPSNPHYLEGRVIS